jgi:hypothetical protein
VFDSRTQNPVLKRIGLSGRHRIFAAYREALLPFLDGVPKSRAELLVRISFHLLAAAIVGKARVDDGALADLSWNVLESEIGTAAIAYLETSIRAGAKPTRIRKSGTRGPDDARRPPAIQIGHLTTKSFCDPFYQEAHTPRLSALRNGHPKIGLAKFFGSWRWS